MSSDRKHSPAFLAVASFLTYVMLAGLWLLLTSNLAKPELYVGLGAAAIATVATVVFEAVGVIQFRPRLIDLAQIWPVPWYLLKDTGLILKAMALQLFTRDGPPSVVLAVPYADVGDDDASAARRALVVTYTCFTPSSVALGIVREQQLLLIHQILPAPVTRTMTHLGARP